jgi:tripartite-type tricarboxylate transporter receptor subunit TctC
MHRENGETIGISLIVAVVLFAGFEALAMEYPTKPITLIIPYPAGGSSDLTGRGLANPARKYLGQPTIAENKPGGGGTIGASLAIKRPAAGYTLCAFPCYAVAVAWHMGTLNFNPIDDVTRIIRYTGTVYGIVVRADAPWKTIQDFVKYAKENPKKVSYGSPGVGNTAHLAMEELGALSGMQLVHIPYKGGAETNAALLGGHVDSVCDSTGWSPMVDAGEFRLLATLGEKRIARYPQVPTLKEVGYDVAFQAPMEIAGPKNLPGPIVKKLHDAFQKAMDDPEYQAVLKKFDMPLLYLNSEDCEKAALKELEKIGKLVQKLGLQNK